MLNTGIIHNQSTIMSLCFSFLLLHKYPVASLRVFFSEVNLLFFCQMSKLEQHLLVERSQQMELVQSLKQKSDHFQKIAEQGEIQIKELTETIQ